MRYAPFLFMAIIVLGSCRPAANYSELTAEDREAIDALRTALVQAILDGDAATYASLCTEDVQLLHPDGPIITGSAALEEHNAAIFELVDVIALTLNPMEVFGAGDFAYEVGTQEVAIEPSDERFRGKRKYVHVLRRQSDGAWRFKVLISNNSE
jgi:uncharacterized protein (TIGR02246 family)